MSAVTKGAGSCAGPGPSLTIGGRNAGSAHSRSDISEPRPRQDQDCSTLGMSVPWPGPWGGHRARSPRHCVQPELSLAEPRVSFHSTSRQRGGLRGGWSRRPGRGTKEPTVVTEGLRYPSQSMTCLISTALSQPVQKRRPNERALVS